jgi:hypothetical protein
MSKGLGQGREFYRGFEEIYASFVTLETLEKNPGPKPS